MHTYAHTCHAHTCVRFTRAHVHVHVHVHMHMHTLEHIPVAHNQRHMSKLIPSRPIDFASKSQLNSGPGA